MSDELTCPYCSDRGVMMSTIAAGDVLIPVCSSCPRRVPDPRLEKAREALADLIELARAAMKDANRDGGEYDVRGELEEAQSALAALDGK